MNGRKFGDFINPKPFTVHLFIFTTTSGNMRVTIRESMNRTDMNSIYNEVKADMNFFNDVVYAFTSKDGGLIEISKLNYSSIDDSTIIKAIDRWYIIYSAIIDEYKHLV
jgi:hypothetical protein